jgi:sulfur carrier protein
VQITLNGNEQAAPDDCSVAELVGQVSERTSGIAVAVNGEVVPRGSWSATMLAAGDWVELVTAVQGG